MCYYIKIIAIGTIMVALCYGSWFIEAAAIPSEVRYNIMQIKKYKKRIMLKIK